MTDAAMNRLETLREAEETYLLAAGWQKVPNENGLLRWRKGDITGVLTRTAIDMQKLADIAEVLVDSPDPVR